MCILFSHFVGDEEVQYILLELPMTVPSELVQPGSSISLVVCMLGEGSHCLLCPRLGAHPYQRLFSFLFLLPSTRLEIIVLSRTRAHPAESSLLLCHAHTYN